MTEIALVISAMFLVGAAGAKALGDKFLPSGPKAVTITEADVATTESATPDPGSSAEAAAPDPGSSAEAPVVASASIATESPPAPAPTGLRAPKPRAADSARQSR